MKYSDGGWLFKEGYDVKFAVHVYDSRQMQDRLMLYMPYSYISNKGATLDGGLLTMEVTTPQKDIVGIKLYNYKGTLPKTPNFKLNTVEITPEIMEEANSFRYKTGDLLLEITKGENIALTFSYKDKVIASSSPRSKAVVIDPNGQTHISDQLNIGVGETIYGLGERFTSFVKNGQSVAITNQDGGTGTEQSYKNIPFYVSSNNYGVFVDSPDQVEFEIGSEKVSKVQFSNPGQSMQYYVIAGDDMKQVIQKYTDLTGKPTMPPAWSFGLWLSTSFLTDYNEETVTSFVDGMQERDIPLEVFHFDCLWMKEYEWCNFVWDERTFPEPEKMLQRLKEKGLKICVWINPYIGQKSPLFEEGMANGYFIKQENGDVWQWDKWQAGMAIVDFTNPKAVAWYTDYLRQLLDMGVDCFKTDFGERIPLDAVYFDGSDPHKMHNYYAYLYNQVVFDLLKEVKGEKEAVVFARAATVGSQKMPVHWGGDSTSDYPSMAETLRAGLSIGFAGFGYWSHDISGFEAEATPDLYKRWTQFGLLSSHSRYHGSWQYKVPWIYGEEAVDVSRTFTKLKLSLMPYLQAQSVITAKTGIPMMRAMVLEFPEDQMTHTLDQQYMLGENLLVAPIFNEDGKGSFYIPKTKGAWTDYLTDKKYESGQYYQENYDYFHLPLLVRPNAIIIEGKEDQHAEYDYNDHPIIHAFEVTDEASATIYDVAGQKQGNVEISYSKNHYHVSITGIDEATIIFHDSKTTKKVQVTKGNFDI